MNKTLNIIWIVLIMLTLISAVVAETVAPENIITILICVSVIFKGGLVADHFMGLKTALPIVRWSVHLYIVVIPLMICLTILFQNILNVAVMQ